MERIEEENIRRKKKSDERVGEKARTKTSEEDKKDENITRKE